MSNPINQARHFWHTANVLRSLYLTLERDLFDATCEAFAVAYGRDHPGFKHERFMAACQPGAKVPPRYHNA